MTGEQYVLAEVQAERHAQDVKWGEQNHPDLSPYLGQLRHLETIAHYYGVPTATQARSNCETEFSRGDGSWFSIHVEELGEALEAAVLGHEGALRQELIQLAATCIAHVEAIDRRTR